ncbi:MAG TPA: metallophosphoesterase, partial [Chloroflexia bacterium]|nr:metallophosphoesterase [Chloroflexia bacterium]
GDVAIHLQGWAGLATVRREATRGTDHVLRLTGLRPGTGYSYILLADGGALAPDAVFHTAPPPGAATPFRFLVWGDSGCGCPPQLAVAAQMAQTHPDLLLHTGDMIYENGEAALYDPRFFSPYSPTLATAPIYPAVGNHDDLTNQGDPWLQTFFLPGDPGTHTTRYYAFNYGNAHFIALDSEEAFDPTSAQYSWLLADLASPAAQTATWRFAFFHQPPYSSGYGHGSSYMLRETWSPLFERYGVDVVFSGHEHNYERTTPRRDYTAVGGTHPVVYIVTGGGGQQLYNVGHQSWTAYADMIYHFVQVQVDGPRLTLEAISADGQVVDQLALNR